jgi:hypothetical protein
MTYAIDAHHGRLACEPAAEHGVAGVEQAVVADAVVCRRWRLLRVHVAQVAEHDHDLVVAQDEVHTAAVLCGLLLEAVDEPEQANHVRAAVRQVAGENEVLAAAAPAAVRR